MFTCPNCSGRLMRSENIAGIYWVCGRCGGKSVGLGVLRKAIGEQPVKSLWAKTREAQRGPTPCPTCGNRMARVDAGTVELDVCKVCQFVWFDPKEYEQIPAARPISAPTSADLPQQAREMIALYKVERMAEEAREGAPDEDWKKVPAFFGFPVECEATPLSCQPLATWVTALMISIISVIAFFNLDEAVQQFGLIPAEAFRMGGSTFLTSFFLHGSVLHLVGNLYFFLIFGDNVEDYLGRVKFLLLLLASTLAGGVAHLVGDPRASIPCVGASGGISGILVFYALQFPQARLGLLLRYYWRFAWIRIPAWFALLLWLLLQTVGAVQQLSGFSNVSSLAHLGGAAIGLITWLLWRTRSRWT